MVFYYFELQLAGIILLSAMLAGGISIWIKRRKEAKLEKISNTEEKQDDSYTDENKFVTD